MGGNVAGGSVGVIDGIGVVFVGAVVGTGDSTIGDSDGVIEVVAPPDWGAQPDPISTMRSNKKPGSNFFIGCPLYSLLDFAVCLYNRRCVNVAKVEGKISRRESEGFSSRN